MVTRRPRLTHDGGMARPLATYRSDSAAAGRKWPLAFEIDTAAFASALSRLAVEDALSVPLLGADMCEALVRAAASLTYRRAKPVIGEGARAVYQDFDLCYAIPPGSMFHAVAAELETLFAAANDLLDPPPLAAPLRLNDLIVQRYRKGSRGITAHRDHIRYEGVVAIVPLSGAARFFVCADRAGNAAREVPAPVGSVVLMRAPGFAGTRFRPFHYVTGITEERLSFGLRHDVRA
jgi:hypothetical protein